MIVPVIDGDGKPAEFDGILLLEGVNTAMGNDVPMFKNPTVDISVAIISLSVLVCCGEICPVDIGGYQCTG